MGMSLKSVVLLTVACWIRRAAVGVLLLGHCPIIEDRLGPCQPVIIVLSATPQRSSSGEAAGIWRRFGGVQQWTIQPVRAVDHRQRPSF